MKSTEVEILGVKYKITLGSKNELLLDSAYSGETRRYEKEIVVTTDIHPNPEKNLEIVRGIVVHELVHAFLFESGMTLSDTLEEMLVCWFERHFESISFLSGMIMQKCFDKTEV